MRWQIFGLACATSWLLYLHRYVWNIVGPELEKTYGFDHTQSGWVFSFFYLTYAGGQIPSGMIIDRWGPHRFLSLSIVVWSLVIVGFAWTSNLLGLGLLRAAFGAAQAGCYPGLNKVTRSWFPLRSRTVIQGWVATTSGRLGGAMSPILLGTLLMGYGGLTWQQALQVLGVGGVAFGVLFWVFFRDTPESHPAITMEELALIREGQTTAVPQTGVLSWREALRNRSLRVFVVQQYFDAGSDIVFISLIGAFFMQSYQVDIKQTGWLASLPLWGGALGGLCGGFLNEAMIRLTGSRRWGRSLVGAAGKSMGGVLLLVMTTMHDPIAAGLMLGVAKFFGDWSHPTVWGACTDLGGRYSATVFSVINTAGTAGGILMPLVFGRLLDFFTTVQLIDGAEVRHTFWSPLFYAVAAMYLGSATCWLLLDCTNRLDPE